MYAFGLGSNNSFFAYPLEAQAIFPQETLQSAATKEWQENPILKLTPKSPGHFSSKNSPKLPLSESGNKILFWSLFLDF